MKKTYNLVRNLEIEFEKNGVVFAKNIRWSDQYLVMGGYTELIGGMYTCDLLGFGDTLEEAYASYLNCYQHRKIKDNNITSPQEVAKLDLEHEKSLNNFKRWQEERQKKKEQC